MHGTIELFRNIFIFSNDFFDHLMTYAYAYAHAFPSTEMVERLKYEDLNACRDAINGTCGVDIETIKQLVCIHSII